jgi:hypothetical protein
VNEPATVEVVATIERRRVAVGTKNDRSALVAEIGGRPFVLRRRGARAFTEDPELAGLVGTTVRLTGTPLSTVFLVDRVAPS